MTQSSPSSWSSTVASLRKASDGRLAGGHEAPAHFERYVNLLFRLTVAHKDHAGVERGGYRSLGSRQPPSRMYRRAQERESLGRRAVDHVRRGAPQRLSLVLE